MSLDRHVDDHDEKRLVAFFKLLDADDIKRFMKALPDPEPWINPAKKWWFANLIHREAKIRDVISRYGTIDAPRLFPPKGDDGIFPPPPYRGIE